MRNFEMVVDFGRRVRLKNGPIALHEGDMVHIDAAGLMAEVADNNTVGAAGILLADVAPGGYGWVAIDGIFRGAAASGADFVVGDLVYTASDSTLDAGSLGDRPVGKVVHTDPAAGGLVYFKLISQLDHEALAARA